MNGRKTLALIAIAWLLAPMAARAEEAGPLARYVATSDESFAWTKRREGTRGVTSWVELTLTSQTWQSIPWKHQLYLFKPSKVRDGSRALLMISGGLWNDKLSEPADPNEKLPSQAAALAEAVEQLGTPVAVVLQVPQQPLFDGLLEDGLISYTFERYLRTGDDTWPLLLPMVKSAVRGMDAVQEFAKQEWSLDVKSFTVTGASKRGWTTWLTAAVDPRVDALAPMVIDTLNMGPQMAHQVATWGKFSDSIGDYTARGLQALMYTPSGMKLTRVIDPYSYREKITQPKLIILGTNDRYWPLDALNLYWDGLSSPKYIMYAPNQGHSIRDIARVVGSIAALHRQTMGELKLAEMKWDYSENDTEVHLRITSNVQPESVAMWTAVSKTRDFRDAVWSSKTVKRGDDGYRLTMSRPASGYQAMFGECVFATDGLPYYLSTNVRIVGEK